MQPTKKRHFERPQGREAGTQNSSLERLLQLVAAPTPRTIQIHAWLVRSFPAVVLVYALNYDRLTADTSSTLFEAWWTRGLVFTTAAASIYPFRKAPWLTSLCAALAWLTTGSTLFAIVASYLLARHQPRGWWVYLVILAGLYPAGLVPVPLSFTAGHALLPLLLVPMYACVAPALLGLLIYIVRESSALRERYLERVAQATLVEERLQISREMHDVLGQQLSLMVLSSTALAASSREPSTVQAATDMAQYGHRAIEDLQYVLLTLRGNANSLDAQRVFKAPPPIVEQLHAARQNEQCINVIGPIPNGIHAEHEDALRAIVREGLHNAFKHAPGACVSITFSERTKSLGVAISNPLMVAVSDEIPAGGFGLRSLREHVEMLGGRFRAGVVENGFELAVELDLRR